MLELNRASGITASDPNLSRMILKRLAVLWFVILALPLTLRAATAPRTYPVWVLSNGFHSAFAFRTDRAPATLQPVARRSRAPWVLVGWGDKQFFMAPKTNLWITIQAVCWPTPSALHVIPLQQTPERVYRNTEIVRLDLQPEQYRRLTQYVDAAFAHSPEGTPVYLGRGFSADSAFFLGIEKFYFPKMCNWWVAAGLREAGLGINPVGAFTAHELMRRVRKKGQRVGGLRLPVDGF